jgi:hypothetical protein
MTGIQVTKFGPKYSLYLLSNEYYSLSTVLLAITRVVKKKCYQILEVPMFNVPFNKSGKNKYLERTLRLVHLEMAQCGVGKGHGEAW